jgi:hypothetical protein
MKRIENKENLFNHFLNGKCLVPLMARKGAQQKMKFHSREAPPCGLESFKSVQSRERIVVFQSSLINLQSEHQTKQMNLH